MNANLNWLTDPTVFRVNRLDAHSDHIFYTSEEESVQGTSSLYQSLDGVWAFHYSAAPKERPENFWTNDFEDSDFDSIQVPGHMELQGYGQIQYINTLYPWDGHAELRPPEIDWDNTPVGSYVRKFSLSPAMQGKRICISFQGVEQAFYVWLNGHFIGYSEDSFTPSDFELTPFLRDGENRLCVEVYKHSSAGWLEDQDFFRFSGIFRSVYLYAKPVTHIEDLWLKPELSSDLKTGTLQIRLRLSGETENIHVKCKLCDSRNDQVFEAHLQLHTEGDDLFSQKFRITDITPWSHKTPYLYHVALTLYDSSNQVLEFIPYDIGFRRFELRDGIMLLNGQRLVINGVNRHEWNPSTGRVITEDDMHAAMETFLQNHINAVRTSHYPNQTPWYHLCDRNGIYMIDETNLESHGSWEKLGKVEPSWNVPGSLPEWKECVLDRAASMFERDKNHPSILFWSCGNEAYAGEDILAMADYFRAQDPSRLVHYEGVFRNREFDAISDIESRMYATPQEIREYLESDPKKPFILCEYMHDMGNSLGGMESYIRLGEAFEQYQGGFIWDYMDQALWHVNATGEKFLGYGGDWDDRQSDYAFSGNGIVFADGTPKPAMQEIRYWYSDPQTRSEFDQANQDFLEKLPKKAALTKGSPLRIVHGDGALGVSCGDFEILFSYPMGGPVSLKKHGREWLWRAPKPAFWRAATENDLGNGFAQKSSIWSAVDQWPRCDHISIVSESADTVTIRYTYGTSSMDDLKTEFTYTVNAAGFIDVSCHYFGQKNRPSLPLFGLRFATPVPMDQVHWLGLSSETYPDRKKGGNMGFHQEKPHIPPYLVPQECGGHEDTHEVTLALDTGDTLHIVSTGVPFGFSAIPYTPQQLEQAFHAYELPEPSHTIVTIYGAMRGVGGIDSWHTDVEEAYHVSAEKDIEFSFRIIP